MYCVKIKHFNCNDGSIIGQSKNNYIVEVEQCPANGFFDITNTVEKFTQRVFDGKFGTEMTYAELVYIRGLLDELGEYGKEAGSLSELELRKEITDIQLAMIE